MAISAVELIGLGMPPAQAKYLADGIVFGDSAAATAIPSLTENSTTIGGTQNDGFATLSVGWNGSAAATAAEGTLLIDAIRETAAKVNAILAALRTQGIIST